MKVETGVQTCRPKSVLEECMIRFNRLMVVGYIFSSDRGLGSIFAASGRSVVELPAHNKQASGKLLSVEAIIADQESLLTLRDYELCDIHDKLYSIASGKWEC